jgi:predicted ATP-dependent endonuclease of OLD family
MSLKELQIIGFRGFKEKAIIEFAVPDGTKGSGLTLITGPNNSGKSSILECLKARGGHGNPSFSVGSRNSYVDYIELIYKFDNREEKIRSVTKGSSEVVREEYDQSKQIYVVPSRRNFNPYFGRSIQDRDQYLMHNGYSGKREMLLSNFQYRLFQILQNPDDFNLLLNEVLGFTAQWTIDQSDQGNYFLKFYNGDQSHTSEGLGEGIVSIFAIIDSIYDSKSGDMIVIDEPELSLHPSLQKRLLELVLRFSQDRQIVISTHSPYFVDLNAIKNGGNICRVMSDERGSRIFQLGENGKNSLGKLVTSNLYNPHIFGTNAKELFFQDNNIILTEGQEDVVLYPLIANQVSLKFEGSFFGWGAGGAENIEHLCYILQELGYKKVIGLLDGDKLEVKEKLQSNFPEYAFFAIPTEDIRTKPSRPVFAGKEGLLDESHTIKVEFIDEVKRMINEMNKYFD